MSVNVIDSYPAGTAGGACYACHAAQRIVDLPGRGQRVERVVDFDMNVDYEGFALLCESCVTEAARALGMLTPTDSEALTDQIALSRLEVADANQRAEVAEAAVAALRRFDEVQAASHVTVLDTTATTMFDALSALGAAMDITPSKARKTRAKQSV